MANLSKADIADLRQRGASDDEILSVLSDRDKGFAGTVGELRRRDSATTSKEILDVFADMPGKNAEPAAGDSWSIGDIASNTGKSAALGVGSVLSGYGNTLDKATDEGGYGKALARGMMAAGKAISPDMSTFKPATSTMKWDSPSTWTAGPRALLEMGPGLVTDIGAGALGTAVAGPAGGVAAYIGNNVARDLGNKIDDRMTYQGKTAQDATTGDYLASGAGAVGEAALSRFGLGKALGSTVSGLGTTGRQIASQSARAALSEAAASVPGSVANQIGRTIGTEKGISIDPNEVANEALLGAVAGGAVRGARGIPEAVDSRRMTKAGLGVDPEADAKAVTEIRRAADADKGGNPDLSTPKASYDAVKGADIRLHQELRDASKNASPFLKTMDAEDASRIETIIRKVKSETLTKPDRETATRALSGDADGQVLLNAIRARSSLNAIKNLGNTENGQIKGGLAETGIVKGIDNKSGIASLIGVVSGNPLAVGAAALRPAAGIVDRMTGARNPVEMATNRLDTGAAPSVDPSLPSRRQFEADALAKAKADAEAQKVAAAQDRETKAAQREERRGQRDADLVSRLIAQLQAVQAIQGAQSVAAPIPAQVAPAPVPPAPIARPEAPAPMVRPAEQAAPVPAPMAEAPVRPQIEAPAPVAHPVESEASARLPAPPRVESENFFPNSTLTDRGTLKPSNDPVDAEAGARWRDDQESKKAARAAEQADGDTFTHDGLTFPIPPDVRSKPHYVNAARHLQNRINEHLARAYNDGQIEQATFNAIEAARTPLKMARTTEDATAVINGLKAAADSADRPTLDKTFSKDFLLQWSKLKAEESRYAKGSDD